MSRRDRAFVAVALVLAAGTLLAMVSAIQTERRSRLLLRDLLALDVGRANFADARKLAYAYDGQNLSVGDQPAVCNPDYCRFDFSVVSNWQHALKVSPRRGLVAYIEISHDKLKSRYVSLVFDDRKYLEVFADERPSWPSGEKLRAVKRDGNLPSEGFELTPAVPESERTAAYDFNLACLSRLKGCAGPDEVLPALKSVQQIVEEEYFLH